MPMVAMNRMIGAWLTSGRSTTRSMANASDDHDADGDDERQPGIDAEIVDQPGEEQRREQHHGALGEVEHARRLEDQDEAERDQRVHHAGHQPADQHLDEEQRRLRDHHEGIDEDRVEHAHGCASRCASQRSKSALSASISAIHARASVTEGTGGGWRLRSSSG